MRSKKAAVALGIVFLCVFATSAFAESKEEAAIKAYFQADKPDYGALFSAAFLEKIPASKMEEIRRQYMSALGELKSVRASGQEYEVLFTKGRTVCRVYLDKEGKIAGFRIGPMKMNDDSLDKILADFKNLSGEFSLAVLRDGKDEVIAVKPNLPLAVGSAFKLYILEALGKKIAAGGASWADVIKLDEKYYSLPSGMTQNWPAGTFVTLQTLAHLMISISDNTATDHLLFYAGREEVEKIAPKRVRPFYSTAEMFRLKYGMEEKALEDYLAADLAQKRGILGNLPRLREEELDFKSEPLFINKLEWLITTREMCEVIYRLRDHGSLRINPGLADMKDWLIVGYKGGSEPGVLNHTYLLKKNENAPWLSLSITVNNPKKIIEEDKFNELVMRLIGLAQTEKFK